jgi:hypothetical protein
MDVQDLASLFMMFDQVQKTEEVNNQRFFSVVGFYYQNFKESTLDRIRTDSRKEVEDELQSLITSRGTNSMFKGPIDKMQAINKFYL